MLTLNDFRHESEYFFVFSHVEEVVTMTPFPPLIALELGWPIDKFTEKRLLR